MMVRLKIAYLIFVYSNLLNREALLFSSGLDDIFRYDRQPTTDLCYRAIAADGTALSLTGFMPKLCLALYATSAVFRIGLFEFRDTAVSVLRNDEILIVIECVVIEMLGNWMAFPFPYAIVTDRLTKATTLDIFKLNWLGFQV